MRTTKVIAFSVMPEFEHDIQKHAANERRTISEYIREAIRQYMSLKEFEATRRKITARMKRKGLKVADVEAVLEEIRRRA